ncbi:hypothetical protein A2960_06235 [Candidatus Gottesmanbacteria bacterium RIFCSPLOWO2_01_FULL_39_12b]|uniref:Haloacid dehalogenase n=1 Tax=Candidatus Gottesmanbacteria bacterium RIFCSPLOWO2_01_FULL_39_12b TaxID=1798388 RepID=A0A1F6AQ91_9BACT|nr:MAG: hypothetical protein A2960_06235 [Candidatus Gottesmanbacteria bacterium RIFCSPLOWO2_01_FULL_39_12b]
MILETKRPSLSNLETRLNQVKYWMTDLDQTSWDRSGTFSSVNPTLPWLFLDLSLRQDVALGVCTSRSPKSVAKIEQDMITIGIGGFTRDQHPIFSGPSIYSDGHQIGVPNGSGVSFEILTSPEALKEMGRLKDDIKSRWQIAGDSKLRAGKYGFIEGLSAPIQVADEDIKETGVFKIMVKGPLANIDYPDYQTTLTHMIKIAEETGIRHIGFMLTANGDIIAVEKFADGHLRSKRDGLLVLEKRGLINLSKIGYFGDAENDLEIALEIKSNGGLIFTVANGIPELKEIADYVTPQPESTGVAHILRWA